MDARYDFGLVVLSLAIAVAASYTTLDLTGRVSAAIGRAAVGWQLAGATIMGAGIWSMHFVGMLAYQLPIPMSYDLRITLLSLGFAILACAISLRMATRRRLSWATLAAGGGLMGIGIGSMHYTGMLAMRMEPAIVYNDARVAASVLIACTASSLALWLSFKLKDQRGSGALRKKAIAAVVMGLGVAGMHYTGMSAAYFPSGSICRAALDLSLPSVRPSDLAYVIAAFVGAVLVMTTVTANLDASRVRQITRHLRDLGTANRALRDDVIARSTAELEVRRLERFVRSTMDSLLDHICVVDATGSIVAVNQAWRRFAAENDADPDAVSEGTNYLRVCQVADGDKDPLGADFAALLVAVLEGRMDNAAIEYPCHSPTVSRWFLARITRFQGEGPDCAVVTHEDITASKLSSLAIAAEAERRRVLFEQAVDGIVLLDSKRRVIEANTSLCRMLGREPETVTDLYPWDWDVLYPTREAFLARWPDIPEQSGTVLTRMRRKDGSDFAAEVTHSLAVWGDARVLLCIVRDITEREHAQRTISDNETRYATVLDTLVDGVIIIDAAGVIVDINRAAQRMFGYAAVELVGGDVSRLIPEFPGSRHDNRTRAVLDIGVVRMIGTGCELLGRHRDGRDFPIDLATNEMSLGGQRMFACIVRDVTERRAQQNKLLHLTRMRAVSGAVGALLPRISSVDELIRDVGPVMVDQGGYLLAWFVLRDGDRFRLASVHGPDPARRIFEAGLGSLASPDQLLFSPSVFDGVVSVPDMAGADIGPESESVTVHLAHRAGAASLVELPLMQGSKVLGCLGLLALEPNYFDEDQIALLRDVAGDVANGFEFIAKTEALKYLTSYDSLTRLANRELFLRSAAAAISQARIDGSRLVLALLDVENFKGVNDLIGHSGGDVLLKQFAARLAERAGAPGQAARVGGDRFGAWMLIADAASDVGEVVQARLIRPLVAPYELQGESIRLRHRAGLALFPDDGDQAESVFRSAEAALKMAKSGNQRLLFATAGLSRSFRERMNLENRLQRAVENQEFRLQYQPKVRLSDGRIEGCEALLRWLPTDAGPVSPEVFVPLLEQSDLIVDVGLWAIRQAMADLASWRSVGLQTRVAINVSPVQLKRADFVPSVKRVLKETGSNPGLDFEVTESMLMTDLEATIGKLTELREADIRISIDDFGTGYSSLSYLAQLPVDALKIDRSFVVRMNASAATLSIVSGVVSLAHALGLKVIAEGVDSADQLATLQAMGCEEIQGWLFSKAVDADQLALLLREGRRLPV